jgi:hypothetical protein
MKFLSTLFLVFFCSCNSDECADDETRCVDNQVEICAYGIWHLDDDCNEITKLDFTVERWQCCERELSVCLPQCEEE